jgi:DNA-binding response OmpR family regulator
MTDDILEVSAPGKPRILVVDDDPEVRELTRVALEKADYEIVLADSGERALDILHEEGLPHLAVIDIRLPGLDGLALCQKIQGISDVPVIMLTVVDDEETVVKSIEEFAEDYIIKPFNPPELVARVGRILKRMGDFSYTMQPVIKIDENLSVDFVRQRAIINDRPLALTPTETKLLYILMQNAGKTVLTNYILGRVWPNQGADENTLRVHIHRLRQKIEVSPSRPRYVVTERGAGYSFLAPADR